MTARGAWRHAATAIPANRGRCRSVQSAARAIPPCKSTVSGAACSAGIRAIGAASPIFHEDGPDTECERCNPLNDELMKAVP